MRKAETYKSLQQHHNSSKKQSSQSFRPEHPKKQIAPKHKVPHVDLNSTRKKEQQLAAHLQSYKNLNRHMQQHNLQMSAQNTLRGSTSKKQYPMKQYNQFNSPPELKSGNRFLQSQPVALESTLSARHSDKLYTRNMSRLAVKGQSTKKTPLLDFAASETQALSTEKEISASTMRINL